MLMEMRVAAAYFVRVTSKPKFPAREDALPIE